MQLELPIPRNSGTVPGEFPAAVRIAEAAARVPREISPAPLDNDWAFATL